MAATTERRGSSIRRFRLPRESELRLGVDRTPIRLRLLSGFAEIFGTELPPEKWLSFPPSHKFAIFTWKGATIELDGMAEVAYVAYETPMVSYLNMHAILDGRRVEARGSLINSSEPSQGPRVMIVGPTDSGKSSLSKMLLSWAARRGWKPTFVDLDIGQGSITIPGCIAATSIGRPIDPIQGIHLEMPIVYFYGHTTPSINAELYKTLVMELTQMLERKLTDNTESRAAGMIINTMGWVEGLGYELLLHAIEVLKVDVVLVLGQEKLWRMLKAVSKNKDVVKLQKSGGVVSRSTKVRQQSRRNRIRDYFYGLGNNMSPAYNVVKFSSITVFRIGSGRKAPRSALPTGVETTMDGTCIARVTLKDDLLHLVLAISYAKEPDQIISSKIAGFIYITDVDMERKRITYLAPCTGDLPSRLLIAGSLAWMEA